jgi:hypothetical protein
VFIPAGADRWIQPPIVTFALKAETQRSYIAIKKLAPESHGAHS